MLRTNLETYREVWDGVRRWSGWRWEWERGGDGSGGTGMLTLLMDLEAIGGRVGKVTRREFAEKGEEWAIEPGCLHWMDGLLVSV